MRPSVSAEWVRLALQLPSPAEEPGAWEVDSADPESTEKANKRFERIRRRALAILESQLFPELELISFSPMPTPSERKAMDEFLRHQAGDEFLRHPITMVKPEPKPRGGKKAKRT